MASCAHRRWRWFWKGVGAGLCGVLFLASQACQIGSTELARDRKILLLVDRLVSANDSVAEAAHRTLVRVGPVAISLIETGLYRAEEFAQLRIIRTLVQLGSDQALPILRHLMRRSPHTRVREKARVGLRELDAEATPPNLL